MKSRNIIKTLSDLKNQFVEDLEDPKYMEMNKSTKSEDPEAWFNREIGEACFSSAPTKVLKSDWNVKTEVDCFNLPTVISSIPLQLARIQGKVIKKNTVKSK